MSSRQCVVCYQWYEHVDGESCDSARIRNIVRQELNRAIQALREGKKEQ